MINDLSKKVIAAESRIRPYIRETVLEKTAWLNRNGSNVYCKCENLQYTGSFKIRGALNRLLTLTPNEKKRGIVTASTGNHGNAFGFAINMLGIKGLVFVPRNTDSNKVRTIKRHGVEVRLFGNDSALTEIHARHFAETNNMIYLSPYNDLEVVAGQGTIGVEIINQLQHIDAIFASIGGGGLISGISAYIKSINPKISVFGCSPRNSEVMIHSIKAGKIVNIPSLPTLSEGTMGGIEPNAITFDFCKSYVDHYITVTEKEIELSLFNFIKNQHMLIEGSAAVCIASYLKVAKTLAGKTVVLIICGSNISPKILKIVLNKHLKKG